MDRFFSSPRLRVWDGAFSFDINAINPLIHHHYLIIPSGVVIASVWAALPLLVPVGIVTVGAVGWVDFLYWNVTKLQDLITASHASQGRGRLCRTATEDCID